jgi:hypothetical protein
MLNELIIDRRSEAAKAPDETEAFIDEALQRVRKTYGSDLAAVFQAISRRNAKQDQRPDDHKDASSSVVVLEHP